MKLGKPAAERLGAFLMGREIMDIEKVFDANVQSVISLMTFDEVVVGSCLASLKSIDNELRNHDESHPLKRKLASATKSLEDISNHKSLKRSYSTIYNQCVVLLVSYFSAAIERLFKENCTKALKMGLTGKNEIKLKTEDFRLLSENFDSQYVELVVGNDQIKFQDMKSIAKAFEIYFGIEIERDSVVNDLILGQAARHIIVHSGSLISEKTIYQLRDAGERSVKKKLVKGELIEFLPEEVTLLADQMMAYLRKVIEKCKNRMTENEKK